MSSENYSLAQGDSAGVKYSIKKQIKKHRAVIAKNSLLFYCWKRERESMNIVMCKYVWSKAHHNASLKEAIASLLGEHTTLVST